jgi:hypothetical protein
VSRSISKLAGCVSAEKHYFVFSANLAAARHGSGYSMPFCFFDGADLSVFS